MNRTLFSVVALSTLAAAPAAAQVCNGFANAPGQLAVAASAHFPEELNSFGAEASYNFRNPLAVNAGYRNTTARGEAGGEALHSLIGGVSAEFVALGRGSATPVSVCPSAQFAHSFTTGVKLYEVPLGVGFGTSIPLAGRGVQLHPYVMPQLVFGRVDLDVVDEVEFSSDWSSVAMVRGGAMVSFDRFYVGGELMHAFDGDAFASEAGGNSTVFGLRIGFRM
jgi:hypothetical protein